MFLIVHMIAVLAMIQKNSFFNVLLTPKMDDYKYNLCDSQYSLYSVLTFSNCHFILLNNLNSFFRGTKQNHPGIVF